MKDKKDKKKDNKQRHKRNDTLKQTRKLDQEIVELIERNPSSTQIKPLMLKLNNLRMELGLPPKQVKDMKRAEGTLTLDAFIPQDQLLGNETGPVERKDEFDFRNIKLPTGKAPETQGQIFYALNLPMTTCKYGKIALEAMKSKAAPKPIESTPLPPSEPKEAQSSVVYQSAPVMRNLQKEAASIVPTAVLSNPKK